MKNKMRKNAGFILCLLSINDSIAYAFDDTVKLPPATFYHDNAPYLNEILTYDINSFINSSRLTLIDKHFWFFQVIFPQVSPSDDKNKIINYIQRWASNSTLYCVYANKNEDTNQYICDMNCNNGYCF